MRTGTKVAILLGGLAVAAVIAIGVVMPTSVQSQGTSAMPRTADGKPDFSGIWEAMNTGNWDIQAHAAKQGPVIALGAAFSVPPGPGIVDGNEIPYRPEALAKKQENGANWITLDPNVKCYMPGIPRAMYMPYPFQIVQGTDYIMMGFEFASAQRTIRVNSQEESPAPAWMGWSMARWDGDTLVVETTDQMPDTWFDRAGNYHSDALKVTERFTLRDRNTINYEATMEDSKVFTRPWKISMPIYRHLEANAQVMEYKCVEFAEELMYGHLRKRTGQ